VFDLGYKDRGISSLGFSQFFLALAVKSFIFAARLFLKD
jgi:hypothetical protein